MCKLIAIAAALLGVCITSWGPSARAKPTLRGHWQFASYGADEGLKNLVNRHIVQTRDLFIWVSSDDGLYRFDGDKFTRFGREEGLPSSQVSFLHASADGPLWVGTRNGLATVSDGHQIQQVPANQAPPSVVVAAASVPGHIWLGTGAGLFAKTGQGTLERLSSYPGKTVSALHADVPKNGGTTRLHAADQDALWSFDGGAWTDLSPLLPATSGERGTARVDNIHRDGQGRLWLRTAHHWWRQDMLGAKFTDQTAALQSFGSNGYQAADRRGGIWAMVNSGLVFSGAQGVGRVPVSELPTPWTWSLLEDHEGTLWLAGLGVHRLLGRQLWSSFTTRDGLSNDIIYPIARDRAGVLWLGTDTGLSRERGKGFEVVKGTEGLTVRDFAETSDGTLWFGGAPAILMAMAPDGTMTRFGAKQGIGTNVRRTMAILPDEAFPGTGKLWLATDGGGLLVSNLGGAIAFKPVTIPGGDGKASANELISDLRFDMAGRLWVGGERGLAVRSTDGTWRRFDTTDGFLGTGVTVLAARRDGRTCAAYFEGLGASCFTYDGARVANFKHYDPSVGLSSNRVYFLGEDATGRLWVGTGAGVDVFGGDARPQVAYLEHFGQSDGLPGDDCDARSFLSEPDGSVWVGTSTGLARFDGAQYGGPVPAPAVAFLNATVGGAATSHSNAGIELAPGQSRLALRYTALSFANPGRLSFQARLGDEPWRSVAGREVSYQGVEPGVYQMQVRGRFGRGVWGQPAHQEVTVRPTFWQTRWAAALLVALAAALLGGGIRWRLQALRRRNRELEDIVAGATAELLDANAALREQSLTDPLTGLRNRRFVTMTIPADVSQVLRQYRNSSDASRDSSDSGNNDLIFFLVDVDHFKEVNDDYGHDAGDRVLEQVATRLQSTLRDSDIAVRWGGEEFLVVARHTDRATANVLAERLVEAIRAQPFELGDGRTLARTISLGYASFPFVPQHPGTLSWEATVGLADQCLYMAKHEGRDRWVGVALGAEAPLETDGTLKASVRRDLEPLVADGTLRLTRSHGDG